MSPVRTNRRVQKRRRTRRQDRKPRTFTASNSGIPNGLDGGVLVSATLLASLGVVMSYSATAPLAPKSTLLPPLFLDHLGGLGLGLVVAGICTTLSLRFWRAAAFPLWALGIGLLIATAFAGVEVNGAQRWWVIPGTSFQFQPVELVKIATVMAVALVASRTDGAKEIGIRRTLASIGLTLPPVLLLVAQPDLGNAVLLSGIVALILFVAGAPWRLLLPIGAVGIAGASAFVVSSPYARRRVLGFFPPWTDASDSRFQLVQSFVAFGNGGLYGKGIGNGWQKLHYLPEVHTDFVLALVAEELGLVGVLLVLGAFAALLVAGTRIARSAPNRFGLLLALGLTFLLSLPALVNAGVVMGVLPTKGLTLPFISYGRTSLVVCLATAGMLVGITRNHWGMDSKSPSTPAGDRTWR